MRFHPSKWLSHQNLKWFSHQNQARSGRAGAIFQGGLVLSRVQNIVISQVGLEVHTVTLWLLGPLGSLSALANKRRSLALDPLQSLRVITQWVYQCHWHLTYYGGYMIIQYMLSSPIRDLSKCQFLCRIRQKKSCSVQLPLFEQGRPYEYHKPVTRRHKDRTW